MYLIIISIVWFLSLFPALFLAMFSPMMFDAPGASDSTLTIAMVTAIVTYPIAVVLMLILSWVFFAKRKHKAAIASSLIPALWILINIVLWVSIEIFCDGSFTC
ncbi:MAG TPA: hypothetical protein DEA82_08385 [Flavobacteriaceae bacterium]|nr:hypothetical protein [Flavobacteriaceae bacterium]|tara:strand:+ start:767 stop:1078 length:312 start_codon:yes stop_codon:yes gene_type:complete